MKAILHIGTEKTGTTSFQSFMHRNRDAVLARGVLYPDRLGGDNHRLIATYGLSLSTADGVKICTRLMVRLTRQRKQLFANRFTFADYS